MVAHIVKQCRQKRYPDSTFSSIYFRHQIYSIQILDLIKFTTKRACSIQSTNCSFQSNIFMPYLKTRLSKMVYTEAQRVHRVFQWSRVSKTFLKFIYSYISSPWVSEICSVLLIIFRERVFQE